MRSSICPARPQAGQPPTAPMGGGFTPTRGQGLPFEISFNRQRFATRTDEDRQTRKGSHP